MWYKSPLKSHFRRGICIGILATELFGWDSQAPTDATWVVKKGDTLWDIAYSLWGDSFQWPKLWNANPSISNPDLIFPGDVLIVPGHLASDNESAADVVLDVSVSLTSESHALTAANDSLKSVYNNNFSDSSLNADLSENSKLDQSFFAKVPFLWFERDPQGYIYPGKGIVKKPPNTSYKQFEKVNIKPLEENYFSVGDTLDIFSSLRFIEINGQTANLIKRSGRCVVLETAPQKITALLCDQWDVITGDERVDKSTSGHAGVIDTITTPSISITGSIITRAEETPCPYPYQTVVVDKGEGDGVQKGDVFGMYSTEKKFTVWRLSAVGITMHVGKSTSSVLLVSLLHNELSEGDKAVLVRKAHFVDKTNF